MVLKKTGKPLQVRFAPDEDGSKLPGRATPLRRVPFGPFNQGLGFHLHNRALSLAMSGPSAGGIG